MTDSIIASSEARIDESWTLQGRVIPPSCTKGDGCILHLQARSNSWAEGHFHIGRIPINSDAAVELTMSLLMPVDEDLLRISFDSKEQEAALDYLAFIKLIQPGDAIAFLTITGLTIIIQADGLNKMFGPSEKCKSCQIQQEVSSIDSLLSQSMDFSKFDSLMELHINEKSH